MVEPAVLGPVLGEQRHHLVAIGDPALLVDQGHPVGIAVEADAEIRAFRQHPLDGGLRRGRTDAVVDVEPVRRDAHRHHLGAELPQRLGRGPVGSAMGAIDHDLEAVELLGRGEGRLDEFDIAVPALVDPLGAADIGRAGKLDLLFQKLLDGRLVGVRQLEPVGAEQLDAVVVERVVRGRDHDPEIGAHRMSQVPDGRGRHRAEQEHVHAGRGETGGQRVFQHVARAPRILADHHPMFAVALVAAKELARRRAQFQRHLGGHRMGVGASPHPVGPKEFPAHFSTRFLPRRY